MSLEECHPKTRQATENQAQEVTNLRPHCCDTDSARVQSQCQNQLKFAVVVCNKRTQTHIGAGGSHSARTG